MRQVLFEVPKTKAVYINDIDDEKIYASTDPDGGKEMWIIRSNNDGKYESLSLHTNDESGCCYSLLEDCIKDEIENCKYDVYEFDNLKEFLEWALKKVK